MASPPPELKFIQPYLQRSAEMAERDPVVAFHCKYFAVTKAMSKGELSPEGQAFLGTLLGELEESKSALADREEMKDDDLAQAYVEAFALNVFMVADKEDREGRANIATARSFLAAATFLDVCTGFPNPDAEVGVKSKYSKWKAADIAKALKEGRTPAPGPPETSGGSQASDAASPSMSGDAAGREEEEEDGKADHPSSPSPPVSVTSPASTKEDDDGFPVLPSAPLSPPTLGSSPSPSTLASVAPPRLPVTVMAANPTTLPPHVSAVPVDVPDFDFRIGAAAQKHAKFAISALQYDDVSTAVRNLRQALALLEPHLPEGEE